MRSAGPSVRSPRPEQLTRQAAPGAGPQRQGGAQGPQPRPGIPASAPSHRPRPRASARRAGGIVRAARAWPQPGARPAPATAAQEGPLDCMVGRGAGFRAGRGLSACATLARRSGPAASSVHGRPLARARCSAGRRRPSPRAGAGRPRAPPLRPRAGGGAPSGSARAAVSGAAREGHRGCGRPLLCPSLADAAAARGGRARRAGCLKARSRARAARAPLSSPRRPSLPGLCSHPGHSPENTSASDPRGWRSPGASSAASTSALLACHRSRSVHTHVASCPGVPPERGRGVTAGPSVTGMESTVGLTWASEARHPAAQRTGARSGLRAGPAACSLSPSAASKYSVLGSAE